MNAAPPVDPEDRLVRILHPDPPVRAAALILALAATGRGGRLAGVYAAATAYAVPRAILSEATLMIPPFAGFPRAIEAFHALEQTLGPTPPCPDDSGGDRPGRGSALFAKIYGRQAHAVRKRLVALHPELERAVIEDAYGRILAREGLDARVREMMAVCALAATPLPRQLKSHLLGALRCGADRDDLLGMLELARFVDEPAATSVEPLFDEVVSPDSGPPARTQTPD